MKTSSRSAIVLLLLLALFFVFPSQATIAQRNIASPTPTYDPLEEPPLPPNPTELELGRNLYWHWCMTCHGDRGQGLTDEFRSIWEPEHQDCWGRGCHVGRPGDEGFPIPTVVPALVQDTHLAQFASVQELSDFLKATHPPQSPGVLKGEEYHAIALFVFTMNGRGLVNTFSTAASTSIPTGTLVSLQDPTASSDLCPVNAIVILIVMAAAIFLLIRRGRIQE